MKNTKKNRKNNKSTKKQKGGIRRNNVAQFITQTAGYNSIFNDTKTGGGPAPAPVLNIYRLEPSSIRDSLQSYGDALQSIVESAQSGLDIYQLPTGAPTTTSPTTPSYNEMIIQYNASKNLRDAAVNLMNTFNGPTGLYKTIYGSTAVFVATPSPAPAMSGGVAATELVPVVNLTQAVLQSKLQAFGMALINLLEAATICNSLYTTAQPLNDVSPSGTTEYTAYTAFRSQQISSESILEAVGSTITSFAGTDDYNPSTAVGSPGLYRSILGDSFVFTIPPAPAPA